MNTVVKTKALSSLQDDIDKLLRVLGGLDSLIEPGDKVLLKPNFNTADPFPASTDMNFLEAVVNLVQSTNPSKIIIGDSCTLFQKTETVMEDIGVFKLAQKLGVETMNFDKSRYIKKTINGKYLKTIRIPEIFESDYKIIILPNLKTHRYARFTMSLKLAVGIMRKRDRIALHARHLDEKIAEINLAYKPDLILLDGRKAFITKGPEYGDIVEPNIIMAGTDRVAIDVEALKILKQYPSENKIKGDIWEQPQIKRAVEMGIGAKNEEDYQTIEI